MNFFERRKQKKLVHHMLHEARHTRHMREDLAEPEKIESLRTAEKQLREAMHQKSWDELDPALDKVGEGIKRVMPDRGISRMREYVEVITVALVVAMGLRAYFIQPFKIPTGSMQPTLYGITYEPAEKAGLFDLPPLWLGKMLVTGNRFVSFKSEQTGEIISVDFLAHQGYSVMFNNGARQTLPDGVSLKVQQGSFIEKGSVIASGLKKAGDHIFVDKIRYNFFKPKRGNIFVFDTEKLTHPMIRQHTFYIKRLAGMPGDRISINPPYLVANGQAVTDPYPFLRVATKIEEGYGGYVLAGQRGSGGSLLYRSDRSIDLADGEYLPLGDNSRSSLDGRYFGAVRQEQVVGPAFLVYWPFTKRWGWTK